MRLLPNERLINMKSKIFPAFLVFSCFFSDSIALPAEIGETDYKRTLFNVENPAYPILTKRIINIQPPANPIPY
jgi:hypothetical protein